MDTFIIALQVTLAAVLAVAAIGKFLDLAGSRQAVREFGVPERFADPLGLALPIAELVLALLLLIEPTARWAAIGAAALFLVFIAAIGYNLSKGRQPDCHCFGQIHLEPAGWPTIVRNGGFLAGALVVALAGGRNIPEWLDDLSDVGQLILLFGAAMVGLGVVQVGLLREQIQVNRHLLARLEQRAGAVVTGATDASEPAVRRAAPFDLPDIHGGRLTLQGLLATGNPALLLFTSPSCGPCNALLPDVAEWDRRFGDQFTVAMLAIGNADDNRAKAAHHGLTRVGLYEWPEVSKPYEVIATPTGVLVHPDGTIIEPNANGRDEIRRLVEHLVSDRPKPAQPAPTNGPADFAADGTIAESLFPDPSSALPIGTAVPRLPLPTLDGDYLSLDDLRGTRTLLLFWNTTCGFCRGMLPDLKEIEEELDPASLRLVIASAGTPDELQEQGLQSTIMLDDGLAAISKAFGAPGTPSAVLIDEHGKVASEIMVGADAVLDFIDEHTLQVSQPAD